MTENEGAIKSKVNKNKAKQRHHDYFTKKAITSEIDEGTKKQVQLAVDGRLEGEVEPLEEGGVKLIVED